MAANLNEKNWQARSTSLKKTRSNRQYKKPHGPSSKNDVLKKAKALDKLRTSKPVSPLSKYEVVPPLNRRVNAYERSDDEDDSWGEEADNSDEDHYAVANRHGQQTFPLPAMNFALVPMQHPGYLGVDAQPVKRSKKKDYSKRKSNLSHSEGEKSMGHGIQTEGYPSGSSSARTAFYSPSQRRREQVDRDPRYPYIHVTPGATRNHHIKHAALKFQEKEFAENYTNDLVDSQLQDEIIPDLFIEVLDDIRKETQSTSEPAFQHHRRFQLYPHPHSKVLPVGRNPQVRTLANHADSSRDIIDDLVEEFLRSHVSSVVRESCSELVQNFVQKSLPETIADKLTDEITSEACHAMFEDVKMEVSLEDFISQHIIEPVVGELVIETAAETLEECDNKEKAKGYEEMSATAQGEFLDGMLLDTALTRILEQGRFLSTDTPLSQFTVDGMSLEILLQRLIEIDSSLNTAVDVTPVKRYHEQVVTDVVMDLLLNELCLGLDDDMKDFDEYELWMSDYLNDTQFPEP
ncbi:uncharacterized protein [Watersipora subatra]|uniref:uncharacterized protein n=1 Tax=Watersipora subatra TaxID=2589382 RepID=UPI00355B60E9